MSTVPLEKSGLSSGDIFLTSFYPSFLVSIHLATFVLTDLLRKFQITTTPFVFMTLFIIIK